MVAPLFASLSGSVTTLQQSSPISTQLTETTGEEGQEEEGVGVAAGGGMSQEKPKDKVYCAASKLSRLLFVLGQGALCTLVYTEKLADAAKKVSDRKDKGVDKDKDQGAVEGGIIVGGQGAVGTGRKKDKGADKAVEKAAGGAGGGEGVDAMEEEMGKTTSHPYQRSHLDDKYAHSFSITNASSYLSYPYY